MKEEVYYGRGMKRVKEKYPDLYEGINKLNEAIYTGKKLDYKTQKLVAIGIVASKCDESATKKQMSSGMAELGITEDEIVDVLRVVLLTAGMPAFNKGMRILEEITAI
ncbi:MAG: carboxymuconolactone decarboxylase family protein [Candidatus Methanofastidiosa archaeon]|nr:carboxymuconolactone decarboxylase family protein [Candidatus Methanofastidiosa archaeon]